MIKKVVGQLVLHTDEAMSDGWLVCDGRELKIQDYRALFACIGAQYGGDGTSTFALPDFNHNHQFAICGVGYFPLEGTHPDEGHPHAHDIEEYLDLRVRAFQEGYRNGIPPIKAHLHNQFSAISDDLTKIEGIGPKSRDALLSGAITSFELLANSRPEIIEEILSRAGLRMLPHSYADQAKMAAAGKWAELQKLQDELFGGRTVKPR